MKYMVTGCRNLTPMDPKMGVQLFEAAKQWINAKLADGTHDLHYVHVETNAGFTITNADSHQEVLDLIYEYPLYPFFDWEVTPLVDWAHAYDATIKMMQKLSG